MFFAMNTAFERTDIDPRLRHVVMSGRAQSPNHLPISVDLSSKAFECIEWIGMITRFLIEMLPFMFTQHLFPKS